ncbi:tropomyosin [Pocillopora verrucosa]|uniref:tropomyosin n=1 Tax=Pocillopora verrucosa TaxID=203993 RepID=UPI00334245A0
MTASYILIQNIRECALFKRHVYHASKKLRGKELERGTILQKDPNDKTRFVVADRNEVFFDRSCVEGLDDKLELLPDALAEDLLEIISLEERLRFFNRETRREGNREDTYSDAELLRPRASFTEDADGKISPRRRRSESRSTRHDEERQKLENELKLQREQIKDLTAKKEAVKQQLTEIDADGRRALRSRRSESTSARQNKERQKLENELKLLREQISTSIEGIKTLENQLSEKSKYYLRRVSNN